MTITHDTLSYSKRTYSRQTFLILLNAAVDTKNYRFNRLAATAWLSAYPGDLGMRLVFARGLAAEGKVSEAIQELNHLVQIDPEFFEAWSVLSLLLPKGSNEQLLAAASAWALGGNSTPELLLPGWSYDLKQAYRWLAAGAIEEAERLVLPIISMNLEMPLPAVVHLRIALANHDEISIQQLARLYHEHWSETLQFELVIADSALKFGVQSDAVDLLHSCVVKDPTAQVVKRLLGKEHAYHDLWPDTLEIDFDMPIPAEIAGLLGWNILTTGQITLNQSVTNESVESEVISKVETSKTDTLEGDTPSGTEDQPMAVNATQVAPEVENGKEDRIEETISVEKKKPSEEKVLPQRAPKQFDDALRPVSEAFEKLAQKLQKPALSRQEGRFPIYVILSTIAGLNHQYGAQTRLVIDKEMKTLADVVRKRPGWGAMVFYPDDLVSSSQVGIGTIDAIDPWKIKLALMDLDKALAKKGAMIGALMIVGGSEVVPFHNLPNPTDDMDQQVLSDNPYATLDGNYFVPEWPIGRIPGEKGSDPGLLLEQIRSATRQHSRRKEVEPWWTPFLFILRWMQRNSNGKKSPKGNGRSFGYSASVWRRSSVAVFRPIGDGNQVKVSPPDVSGSIPAEKITSAMLNYYNLHGLPDTNEWYGQRDLGDTDSGPDYPVAITAKDLAKNGRSPRVVFSEACYGGYVVNKTESESIALRFLQIGTQAVVGSTCVSYGSVTTPLIGADMLGYLFWKHLGAGMAVGEALMQAKLDFVREMNRRQGFVDAEDQKTLLSFVLFGDPLAVVDNIFIKAKAAPRLRNHLNVRTSTEAVSDTKNMPKRVTKEMLREVKSLVEDYLPGLDTAKVSISEETVQPDGHKKAAQVDANRVVVTISKEVRFANHIHHHFARATVDSNGKVVKLAISR